MLLVYPFDAPFIETDSKLLGTFCDVSALQVHTKGDYGRLFTRVRSAEVVFSWFALPFAAVAACLARLSGRIAIVAAGGWDIARIPEIGYGRLLTVRGATSAGLALSLSHSVLAFSESSAEMIRSIAPGSRVRTAYLGVDPSSFRPKSKEDLVVTVANVTSENIVRKGLLQFVEAAREIPDIRFVLVGRHFDDAVERLRSAAPPNVSFTGWLSTAELCDLLGRAKVYVQPSFTEGFGVALAEAMASGCVPVVTRRGAIPELVGESGIYVEYGDHLSLASGIRAALRSKLASQARDRVLARFTLAHRLATLREVILGLTSRVHPSTGKEISILHRPVEEC